MRCFVNINAEDSKRTKRPRAAVWNGKANNEKRRNRSCFWQGKKIRMRERNRDYCMVTRVMMVAMRRQRLIPGSLVLKIFSRKRYGDVMLLFMVTNQTMRISPPDILMLLPLRKSGNLPL